MGKYGCQCTPMHHCGTLWNAICIKCIKRLFLSYIFIYYGYPSSMLHAISIFGSITKNSYNGCKSMQEVDQMTNKLIIYTDARSRTTI